MGALKTWRCAESFVHGSHDQPGQRWWWDSCFFTRERRSQGSVLLRFARKLWIVPEVEDCGLIFAHAMGCTTHQQWRHLCKRSRHDQYLGGVKNCHPESGAILLAYRNVLRTLLQESNFLVNYDWIVFTRSDYFHTAPPFSSRKSLNPDAVHIPSSAKHNLCKGAFTSLSKHDNNVLVCILLTVI